MNIKDKVFQLIKYCGSYEGHSYMMDERNGDSFNISLPQELEIREKIHQLRFILMTGEAGDGKTRMLRNIQELLEENGFQICMDFSAENESDKKAIIEKVDGLLDGKSSQKYILAANIGIFTKTVLQHCPQLLDQLKTEREDLLIINFERRNLAADKNFFEELLSTFLSFDRKCECGDTACPWRGNCIYGRNIIDLLDRGGEGLRTLCDAVYLMGGHITFRELLSLISYMVTFGQDCEQRKKESSQEKFCYYQIFGMTDEPMLRKFCCLDPAKARTKEVDKLYGTKEECISEKRRYFFETINITSEERYTLLYADYLAEFHNVLRMINGCAPYYFSTIEAENKNLERLKLGLNTITRAGNTNLKMTVADTPSIFDGSIQTEFDVSSDIETVWKRYDLDLRNSSKSLESIGQENRFYLSYVYADTVSQELQEVSMLIDYPLFRFLLMAADNYFMDRSGISIEEYAINTFYRKVLHSMPEAYRKAHIRFGETKRKHYVNFSLELKKQNSLLFGQSRKVIIEKELGV